MSILGNLLISIAKVLSLITNMYTFIIAGAVIISWVKPDPYNPIVRFIYSVTDPVFAKVRKHAPQFLYSTGIDFTPLLVIIILVFLENFVAGSIMDIGLRLKYGTNSVLP